MQMIEAGDVELISSSVVGYENSRNPSPMQRKWVQRCIRLAIATQRVNVPIRGRAQQLETEGIKALDALHVACAEAAGSEYLLTCDDRLIRRYTGELNILNPVDFIRIIGG